MFSRVIQPHIQQSDAIEMDLAAELSREGRGMLVITLRVLEQHRQVANSEAHREPAAESISTPNIPLEAMRIASFPQLRRGVVVVEFVFQDPRTS